VTEDTMAPQGVGAPHEASKADTQHKDTTMNTPGSMTIGSFVELAKSRLMPSEGFQDTPLAYCLRCPSGKCGDKADFVMVKASGAGYCGNEATRVSKPVEVVTFRNYSPWEIARLLGLELPPYGGYGNLTYVTSVSVSTDVQPRMDSLRGLRAAGTEIDKLALALLHDPWMLDRLCILAGRAGIAGEELLVKMLYLIVTSRLAVGGRIHGSMREESGVGKSTVARFVLSTLPLESVMHLSGGMSRQAISHMGDISWKVMFVDEADVLPYEALSLLREATTASEVRRAVTLGDASTGFKAEPILPRPRAWY
jgi:hypothetical protein